MKRKQQLELLEKNYLFIEVASKIQEFKKKYPEKKLLSLSVGDTTQPLSETIAFELSRKSASLGTEEGYQGYGPEEGSVELRQKIASDFYKGKFSPEEINISDGAICDLGRLFAFFGQGMRVAIQDPSYPGYLDASLLLGSAKIILLPCNRENHFFPDLQNTPEVDLIFFCSPNNPTGYAATFEQLQELIAYAKRCNALLLFDAAYAHFIQEKKPFPRSIYDIPGSEEVAIEIHSFSKFVGFTGVRLGWTVVPQALKYEDGQSVNADWKRFITTVYNGTSVIAQAGGLAAFTEEGKAAARQHIQYYMENTRILRMALEEKGYQVYGGKNAPYLWIDCKEQSSWAAFDEFLEKKGVITMPGIGFGQSGANFLRLTGFGKRSTILEAVKRLNNDRMDL